MAGLRGLTQLVQEEVKKVPLGIDIMENEVIGPAIREGMERGRQQEGLRFLRLHIEKRFGSIPPSFDTKLAGLSIDEIELLANRVFDASSITDLLI